MELRTPEFAIIKWITPFPTLIAWLLAFLCAPCGLVHLLLIVHWGRVAMLFSPKPYQISKIYVVVHQCKWWNNQNGCKKTSI